MSEAPATISRSLFYEAPRVSADGAGLVSRPGALLLRELTVNTGLAAGWTTALLDTYKALPTRHAPGRVLADLAVMIADGGDALTHLATLRDQSKLFGMVASEPTAWRAVDRVDAAHLERMRAVRAAARERVWAAGAGPELAAGLTIDLDAMITIAHSEKDNAAKTWKNSLNFVIFRGVLGLGGRGRLAGAVCCG